MKFLRQKNAQSVLEYIIVITFVISAFLVFQKYIVRGMAGRWKAAGDAMGQGRLYDPNKTVECAYYYEYGINKWYDYKVCDATCLESACLKTTATQASCEACINSCANPLCDD